MAKDPSDFDVAFDRLQSLQRDRADPAEVGEALARVSYELDRFKLPEGTTFEQHRRVFGSDPQTLDKGDRALWRANHRLCVASAVSDFVKNATHYLALSSSESSQLRTRVKALLVDFGGLFLRTGEEVPREPDSTSR